MPSRTSDLGLPLGLTLGLTLRGRDLGTAHASKLCVRFQKNTKIVIPLAPLGVAQGEAHIALALPTLAGEIE